MTDEQKNTEKILTWEDADKLTGEHIVIPEMYAEIGRRAFEGRSEIKTVTIPDSIKNISERAFHKCTSLSYAEIPASVTNIGRYAFADCGLMTRIDVDKNNPDYSSENGVLFNKDKTVIIKYPVGKTEETYVIPNSVSVINYNAFPFSKLVNVTFPDNVTSIGQYAFNECRSLTNITIPDSVKTIESMAFQACKSLTGISIPMNVTEIGNYVFNECDSLMRFDVDENNPNYSSLDGVLFNKDKTTIIKIPIGRPGQYIVPDSVTTIMDGAIDECGSLTGITFPDGVADIRIGTSTHTFHSCMSLEQVTIGVNNPEFSSEDGVLFNKDKTELIFYPPGKADKVYVIPDTVAEIGERAFEGNAFLTSVKIPDGMKSILTYAFSDCESLKDIVIPASVEEIDQYVFSQCNSLDNMIISDDNPNYTSENKVLFNKNKTRLIEYSNRKAEDHYVIPDSVKGIAWFAFCDCASLKSVNIPEGLKTIGNHAFECCDGITEIVLPKSMASIEYASFSFCSNLKKIIIPDSVTDIDTGTLWEDPPFFGCHPDAVATYRGKTYHAEALDSNAPYSNLPLEFYEAIGKRAKNDDVFNIVVDGSE